jgi:hypothetical protein
LIDKEEIKPSSVAHTDSTITLKKLAFIVPREASRYVIHGPSNLSDCTFIHISQNYLDSIEISAEQVEFSGNLVELLEKYKSHDDVQIFFLAEVKVRDANYDDVDRIVEARN